MAKRRRTKKKETTVQRLSSIIKGCRNIMRKDKGMNGDADRLPLLTWLMFLKFIDDKEQIREKLEEAKYQAVIEAPYRWRDWATGENALTGDDLLDFINKETTTMPDGTEGSGLLHYLRNLQSESGQSQKDVLATIFKGLTNRMINGYLLREVVTKINEIHFTSNEEVNTLSLLYESLLKEMRDASGDAGEFYTPRPVVRFMVEVMNPQLGETILDPAAGTGGFLVAAFEHIKKQANSTAKHKILQQASIEGGEAKPLPYLLCQMNLLLHGLEYPNIDPQNSLRKPLKDMGDSDRVDIILTNPPFGGEEEKGILNNFPVSRRTAETTLLFLQLIMRRLRKKTPEQGGGRAAVVVPNGTLFATGVAGRIKKHLTENFNLHTILRFGDGVFAPYTNIPSNVLFFEQGRPTSKIWYYELPVPDDRKKYSKTRPINKREFEVVKTWWNNREETEQAWCVDFAGLLEEKTAAAQPFWDKAHQAKENSAKKKELLKNLKETLKTTSEDSKDKITLNIKALEKDIEALKSIEKDNQKKGDDIYWTAFNLDIKNPNRKSEFEYQAPEQLMASILNKEKKVMKLMEELEELIIEKEVFV